MSTALIQIRAMDCNAWASDALLGPPSPLSVYLYLRALLAKCASLGLGEVVRYAVGLDEFEVDRGSYSNRPLMTYNGGDPKKMPPLFDEHRATIAVRLAVQTSNTPEQVDTNALAEFIRVNPFLGGLACPEHVRWADSEDGVARFLSEAGIVVDKTPEARAHFANTDPFNVARAILMANTPPEVVKAVSDRYGITPELWSWVSGRSLRVTPLGYRRMSSFEPRQGMRHVLLRGEIAESKHAYVESIYGVTEIVGTRRALQGRMWWRPVVAPSLSSPIPLFVEGEIQHG